MEYTDYLKGKQDRALKRGFEARDTNPMLFPFQKAIVEWACRLGRAAIFADCGLGKTAMQLEWARQVCVETGGDVIIFCPLAVAPQTAAEGEKFGVGVTICSSDADVRPGINITNYEKIQHFTPARFAGIVIDESSILKSFTGATRTALQEFASVIEYRLACTATPAPNDHMELGTHSEFLGVMNRVEMLATYFCHDGGETQKWRLKGHAESAFWKWVASWAVAIRFPSDIGFSDDGYILPELRMHDHPVEDTSFDKGMTLFGAVAATLEEQRDAKKSSVAIRVQTCADVVATRPDEQWVVWCELNTEGDLLTAAIPGAVQVSGSDTDDHKAKTLLGFANGDIRVLVTKGKIAGFGMNFQKCHNVAFVGVTHSFEGFYQSVRRCWRFGQQSPVDCHVFYASSEGAVVSNLRRKESDAERMASEMVKAMSEEGMIDAVNSRYTEYETGSVSGKNFTVHNGDCVEVMRSMPSDSVHFSVFSPPFASLYTYSNSERDMGNCKNPDDFATHFGYAVDELYRIIMPGRLVSFHCMNMQTSKERDGYIGIYDFRGDLIRLFQKAGFIYHSEVVIWKDPVTAMQRTKALGLLHKTIRKDSSMSRQGIPDYLVTMRKPGENPERIAHTHDDFPVSLWQRYASPVWMDINPSNTLQKESAREEKDERHICPLQLQVIERALALWSNPGDTVFSPFAGIGSEGYVAINNGRKFIGAELKKSYFDQAVANLRAAEVQSTQTAMFADAEPEN